MKALVLIVVVAGLAVAGFIGYRATQPRRHCRVVPGTYEPGTGGYPGHIAPGYTACWKS